MIQNLSRNDMEYPIDLSERFYLENYRGAWVRAGISLFMWLFALGAYYFDIIKSNNMAGISGSVAFLILMNPPLLFILKKFKKIYILNFLTLFINLLEIAAYTSVLYFLGGIRALWLSALYTILINYMGIVGRRGSPYIIATMAGVLMAAMVMLVYTGILPDQDFSENTRLSLSTQVAMIVTITGYLYVVALFSAYGRKLLKQSRKNLKNKNLELEEKNRTLKQREKELLDAHLDLENRVNERTAMLEKSNSLLAKEIDERIQAEKRLKESKNRLDEAQAVAHLGSWEFNIKTNALVWSSEMYRIYGYDKEEGELPYEVFVNAIHPEDYDRVITTVANAILMGTPYEIKYRIIRPSGEERISLSRCAAIKDKKNVPIRLVGTGMDITELEKVEAEKLSLEEALRQSQKMEAVGKLAGGIAHEFNNILSIVIGNAELALIDEEDRKSINEQLNEILSASHRAKDVVKEMLSFARQDKKEHEPVEINSVILSEIKLLRASIPSTIEIRSCIETKVDTILGSPDQIKQVVMNLAANAVYAMSENGGILEIGLENVCLKDDDSRLGPGVAPGNFVKLTVSDTGHGIHPKDINRIFEPFFTTKTVGEGSGLGLSVVHGIVSDHGGIIKVKSSLNKGTIFDVFFPAISDLPASEILINKELPRGSERILFVDDEESIVRLSRKMIGSLGYAVEANTNPVNALELFSNDPKQFDLVITDMTMPQMRGDKLAKKIMQLKPDIPIIICTGYSEKFSEDKAKELGIRKYLNKPFDLHKLAFTIRKALDG